MIDPVQVHVPSLGGDGQQADLVVGLTTAAIRVGDRACLAPYGWLTREQLAEVVRYGQLVLDVWPEA